MPENIRSYVTTDGRELPCIGTLVAQSEVLVPTNPPEGLTFYLDAKNQVMVHFVNQHRRQDAVEAELARRFGVGGKGKEASRA
jgi:hypothetical protein